MASPQPTGPLLWPSVSRRYIAAGEPVTFRFNVRECPAIVAYTYNCPRAFFSRLDETLAYCADDAEMSFVCAHTNNFVCRLPFGLRCRKFYSRTITPPI